MSTMQLIVAALPLLLATSPLPVQSEQSGSQEHQETAANKPEQGHQLQIESLLATLQASNAAMLDQLRSMQTQEKAEAEKDRADRNSWYSPSVITQLLLFLVGACYTFFAWQQWDAIREQARIANDNLIETRRAADAAKKSADALQEAEAALLDVVSITQPTDLHVTVKLRNLGRTAASIDTALLRAEKVAEVPPVPSYNSPGIKNVPGLILPPGRSTTLLPARIERLFQTEPNPPGWTVTDPLPTSEFPHCIAYGFVIYEDVFRRRFQLGFGAERIGQRFRPIHSTAYNYLKSLNHEHEKTQR